MNSDYSIDQTIHEGRFSKVQRAVRRASGERVILKMCATDYPSASDIARLHNEWSILQELDDPHIIRAHGLEELDGRPVLSLTHCTAPTLRTRCGEPFDVRELLHVAIKLCTALETVHGKRIVHRDIKPENILFDRDTDEFKLLDFNISMRLGADSEQQETITDVAGTLPYLAPEQTGRTGASIDERTDLYSAGVMLYEFATGRLPFMETTALELIHQHLTATPPPIRSLVPRTPPIVVAIIDRMLAKNPSERYQSARGLRYDLERASSALAHGDDAIVFALGDRDVSDRLHIPDTLYGRDGQLARLLAIGERTRVSGQASLALIAGAGGVGKSSLVAAFARRANEHIGFIASGKCEAYQRTVPQKPILDALQQIIRHILGGRDNVTIMWAERIGTAVSPNGAALTDVLPELEILLGPQPPLAPANLVEASNRFRQTLRKLVQCLARPDHPLILFIDDLQWADAATIGVLSELLTDPAAADLLVIGAFRDIEVHADALSRLTIDLSRFDVPVERIALDDLDRDAVTAIVSDALRIPSDGVSELATLIHKKTHGNPFFVRQFVGTLVHRGLLQFDADQYRWRWDDRAIADADITDNVVELLLARMRAMTADVREILQWAGCLGSHAHLGSLMAMVPQVSLGDLATRILVAIRHGLLKTDAATERLLQSLILSNAAATAVDQFDNARISFVHDRVQQAAYDLADDVAKPSIHLHVGRFLRKYLDSDAVSQYVFDIVENYRHAGALIETLGDGDESDGDERFAVIALALDAAQRARAANAHEVGIRYAQFATSLLPETAWESHYEYRAEAARLEAACLSLSGAQDAAEALCRALDTRLRTDIERAALFELRMRQHHNMRQFSQALDMVFAVLALFGVEFPATEERAQEAIGKEVAAILSALGDDPSGTLRALPVTDDPKHEIVCTALSVFFRIGYNADKPNTATLGALRSFSYTLNHGITASSSYATCMTAFLMMQFFSQWQLGIELGAVGAELATRNSSPSQRALTELSILAFIAHWHRPVHQFVSHYLHTYEQADSVGDYETMNYSLSAWSAYSFHAGMDLLEIHRGLEQHLLIIRRTKSDLILPHLHSVGYAITRLTRIPIADMERGDASIVDGTPIGTRVVLALRCALHVPVPDEQLLTLIDALPGALAQVPGFSASWEGMYAGAVLSAQLSQRTSGDQRNAHLTRTRTHLATLQTWRDNGNVNLVHRIQLIEAELAWCEGDMFAALRGFSRAIQQSHDIEHLGDEALAAERAAALCRELDMAELVPHYLSRAHAAYDRWGAIVKVEQFDKILGRLSLANNATSMRTGLRSTGAISLRSLDIDSVVKAALAIAREIRLPALLTALMRVIMENAGAERAAVLMARDDELQIMAESRSVDDIVVHAQPFALSSWSDGPRTIVRYVQRTRTTEFVNDATAHERYSGDPYVRHHQTRSMLCLPIEQKGMLLAVLYLENRALPRAFTTEHLALLGVLAGQMATSLENARLVRDLESALSELSSTERLKHEFLATISHELRTPLNAIINLPGLLRDAIASSARNDRNGDSAPVSLADSPNLSTLEAYDILDTVQQSGHHLLGVIDQMILFTRLEAGILTLKRQPVDIGAIIARVIDAASADAAERQLTIQVDTAATRDVTVPGDPTLLRHIIDDILANAIKFSPKTGVVAVRTQLDHTTIAVSIRDSGPGIPPDSQQQIFEIFRQGSSGSTRQYGGAGLGLTVTKRLVQLHGGTIEVDSAVGDGSTFTVQLPR